MGDPELDETPTENENDSQNENEFQDLSDVTVTDEELANADAEDDAHGEDQVPSSTVVIGGTEDHPDTLGVTPELPTETAKSVRQDDALQTSEE